MVVVWRGSVLPHRASSLFPASNRWSVALLLPLSGSVGEVFFLLRLLRLVGGAAGLGWGGSTPSHTRSATSSPSVLLLLRVAVHPVSIYSPEMKWTPYSPLL